MRKQNELFCLLVDICSQINEDKEAEPLLSAEDNSHVQNVEKNQDRSKLSPEPSTSKTISPVANDRSRSKTPEKTDSKTSSEKSASKTVSEKSDLKTLDPSDSKPYKTGLKTPDKSGSKTLDKTGSKTPDKAGSKTPDKTGSKTPDKAGSKTPNKERSKTPDRSGSRTPEEKNSEKKTVDKSGNLSSQPSAAIPTGGNIFAQIDPTVKKTSPSTTTPTSLGKCNSALQSHKTIHTFRRK